LIAAGVVTYLLASSVVASGVAVMAAGLGLALIFVGLALRSLARRASCVSALPCSYRDSSGASTSVLATPARIVSSSQRMGSVCPVRHLSVWSP
jgi:hypothetical protein